MHPPTEPSIRLIQFTDCHLVQERDGTFLGIRPLRALDMVIEMARRTPDWPPDLVLLTGDLAQDARPDSYRRIRGRALEWGVPTGILPGNHDDPQRMADVFVGPPFTLGGELSLGDWLIVLLDSTVTGEVGGRLDEAELDRLERCLQASPLRHALVCLHHQPIPVGSAWIDALGLDNAADFLAVIDRCPSVRGVAWGHVHQAFETMRKGIRYLASPSTGVQFEPGARGFAVDPIPPGYRTLTLHPDGRIDTGIKRIADLPEGLQLDCIGY